MSKKLCKVFIPFLLANFAIFVGSTPKTSNFCFLNPLSRVPSLDPMSIAKGFLENSASEQGSRMTAMDNATRNAGDLVEKLTINYNRSRQAAITKELIEIISGAESL